MGFEPLIPFFQLPELPLIPADTFGEGIPAASLTAKPFGLLVATGVYVGSWLVMRQGRRLGFDPGAVVSLLAHVLVGGFVCGHLFAVLWYFPQRAVSDPLSLLRIWEGQSSFGGFLGSVIGGFLWKLRWRGPLLPYADLVCSSLPVGWVFGRAGCSVAHDHPGIRSDAWFAVQYPGGGRLDLGLLELCLTVAIALPFLVLRRRPRPWGFFPGLLALSYGPARFMLDFLRPRELPAVLGAPDARYASLTPAQWCCIVLVCGGVYWFWRALGSAGDPAATRPPRAPTRRFAARGS